MTLGIIFPVYNEEKRLESGVRRTAEYAGKELCMETHIYIVDNASSDRTGEIGRMLESEYGNVTYCRIEEKGVGAAFRKGVELSGDDVAGYMDIDLSTDISGLKAVERIFAGRGEYDMVNASRFQKKSRTDGRRWYRNITSAGLVFLLKTVLGMRASDAICGFKFFKRDTAAALIAESSGENGWFFIIELLLRAERKGCRIYELPVRWRDDAGGSKVNVLRVTGAYLSGIRRLYREFGRL